MDEKGLQCVVSVSDGCLRPLVLNGGRMPIAVGHAREGQGRGF